MDTGVTILICNEQGPYLERVKELAELKRKQDEDKLAARLHSFWLISFSYPIFFCSFSFTVLVHFLNQFTIGAKTPHTHHMRFA